MSVSRICLILFALVSPLKTVSLDQNMESSDAVVDTSRWANTGLHSAMNGFDPRLYNTFLTPNPGYKSKIFEPIGVKNGRHFLKSFIGKAESVMCCNGILNKNIIKSYSSYKARRHSDFMLLKNTYETKSNDITTNIGENCDASDMNTTTFSLKDHHLDEDIKKYFLATQGEIIELDTKCMTYSVSISSFGKPAFTNAFTTSLKKLHIAALNPNSKQSNITYVRFVKEFGTHYMKHTKLGSKIIFQKLFVNKSSDQEGVKRRQDCIGNSAHISILGNNTELSWHDTFSENARKCDESNDQSQYLGIPLERVIQIGNFRSNIENWSNVAAKNPVPILFETDKIAHLARSEWINKIRISDDDIELSHLNGSLIASFLELKSTSYCELLQATEHATSPARCHCESACQAGNFCVTDGLALGNCRCAKGEWNFLRDRRISTWQLHVCNG